jgi:hypothetical protein
LFVSFLFFFSLSKVERSAIFICQKLTVCNWLVVLMGGVFWKGKSREMVKPTTIAWLNMKDICILCNVIEIFWWRNVIKIERWELYDPFKLQMELVQFFGLNMVTKRSLLMVKPLYCQWKICVINCCPHTLGSFKQIFM